MSNTILFDEMIEPNIKKYRNMLENMYYQKILQLQFLIKDELMLKAELMNINKWYRKELEKCRITEKNCPTQ